MQSTLEKKPYKLFNPVQHYEWGSKNEKAFIADIIGVEPQQDLPYAELWIGAHPKAPSNIELNGEQISLQKLIEDSPNKMLGERIVNKFGAKLPYLFKVLSANQALSIQAHPDKKLAEKLHEADPQNYPDDNHKPEIAIALDKLTAIAGFKPAENILEVLEKYDGLREICTKSVFDKLRSDKYEIQQNGVKDIYSTIMKFPHDKLSEIILKIKTQIQAISAQTAEEKQFLMQFENYGTDVGLISILLFNIYNLEKWQAFFTGAGIPHAYIKGNILECMANSDNVVRAGLTPKYKDTSTLIDMLTYDLHPIPVITKEGETFTYITEAEEFELTLIELEKEDSFEILNNEEIKIIFIIEGNLCIEYVKGRQQYKKGEAILLPAFLDSYKIEANTDSKIVEIDVP